MKTIFTHKDKTSSLRSKFKGAASYAGHIVMTDAVTYGAIAGLLRFGLSATTSLGAVAVGYGLSQGLYSYGRDMVGDWRAGRDVKLWEADRARKATARLMIGTATGIFGAWIFQPGTLKLGLDIVSKYGGETVGSFAQNLGSKFLSETAEAGSGFMTAAPGGMVPAVAAAATATILAAEMVSAKPKTVPLSPRR